MIAAIYCFNSTVCIRDVKFCSHPLLLTDFLFVYFRKPVTVKQTSYWSSYIVSAASMILKQEQPLDVATFSQKRFFRTPSCLEELLLSNNYFLLTNTFSDQLLLEYRYIFGTATVMFGRGYFLRISNYSKHVLFRRRRFFRTATFSEE